VQIALSLVLLSAGGLVVRSFDRLLRSDPGFRPEGVVTIPVPLPAQSFATAEEIMSAQDRIHTALAGIPGIASISAADALPLTASANQTTISIPGAPGLTGDEEKDRPLVDVIATRAGYVDAIGMRVVAGRAFEADPPDGVNEALIDRHLAAHFFPSGTPLGAEIPFGDDVRLRVVGVVDQARLYDVHEDGLPQLFVRSDQFPRRRLAFVLRTERESSYVVHDVRAALQRVAPRLARGGVLRQRSNDR